MRVRFVSAPGFAGITLFQNNPLNKLVKVFLVPLFFTKEALAFRLSSLCEALDFLPALCEPDSGFG
jgi:hypothetical protein